MIEKYEDKIKNSDFEQNYWSRAATGIYKIGHDRIRLTKRACYYDRLFYENVNYFDLMGTVCKYNMDTV